MKHFLIVLFSFISCSGNTENTHPENLEKKTIDPIDNSRDKHPEHVEQKPKIVTPAQNPPEKKIIKKSKPELKEDVSIVGKAPVKRLSMTFNSAVSSLSIDKNCSAIVAGGTSMDLYFHSISDKKSRNWILDNVKNGCHREKCKKPVHAAFFPDGNTILVALNGDTIRVVDRRKRVLGFRGGYLQESRGLAFGPKAKSFAVLYNRGLYIFRLPSGLICKQSSYTASRIFSFGNTLFASTTDKLDILDFKLKNKGSINIKSVHSVVKSGENYIVSNSEYFYLLNGDYKLIKTVNIPQKFKIINVFSNTPSILTLVNKNNTYYIGHLSSDLKLSGVREITGFSGEIKTTTFSSSCLAFSDGKSVYMWKYETEN
ncbi:hypothetical protein KKF34_04210 [Myxococcota bacterium]|nr:hypothetical protein [Myxococcota bacterium]MBU1379850.1 hypothetical protein [Myxococcota bacterium]MBU1496061.1 hypothetical protein [Myxococcota bacterium]